MQLQELLKNIYSKPIKEEYRSLCIEDICSDSRKLKKGSLFVAVEGPHVHGTCFSQDAIKKGARVIVTQSPTDLEHKYKKVCFLKVEDSRKFLVDVLLRFYDNAPDKIRVVGVTGTNGKTTITFLLESIIDRIQKSCGVIGTVNHRFGDKIVRACNTTPGLIDNHQYIREMVKKGTDYCIMEVSSHALAQRRVDGINFNVGIFTNLTQEHLDYHNNMDEYFNAKALLFQNLGDDALALINTDDVYGQRLCAISKGKVKTYGIDNDAGVMAKNIQSSLLGSSFTLMLDNEDINIETKLVGKHNIYNILAAAGVCYYEGISLAQIKEGIEGLLRVPGRLDRILCGQDFNVFIDYAHTQDALKNVLKSLKGVCEGKIILAFGCGGDRDREKRPEMGKIACHLADDVVVTSDNPRSEDPQSIIDEIVAGIDKDNYTIVLNRIDAIHLALDIAEKGDTVLIAGKGHEEYQILKDKTIDFNERKIIEDYLKLR